MKHGRAAPGTGWTFEQDTIIKLGLDAQLTTRQIAELLPGRTRNAVIGRINRCREKFFGKPVEVVEAKQPPAPRLMRERAATSCAEPKCRNTRQPGRDKCAEHLPRRPLTVGSRPLVDTGAAM